MLSSSERVWGTRARDHAVGGARRRHRRDPDRQERRVRLRVREARRDVWSDDPDAVRLVYTDIKKPGVRFLQQTITAIDPDARRVTTDGGDHEADVLVVALGADYDLDATPGLAEGGDEFYSVGGAERLREVLPTFSQGRAMVGVCGAPFKCPPGTERGRVAAPRLSVGAGRPRRIARSPSSSRSGAQSLPHRIPPARSLPPLPRVTSSSSPAAA